jgi:hypothetical protein
VRTPKLVSAHESPSAIAGELVDVDSFAALAAAGRRRAGRAADPPDLRERLPGILRVRRAKRQRRRVHSQRVRAYRDELERAGRSPATIAKHLSALRTLAPALGWGCDHICA